MGILSINDLGLSEPIKVVLLVCQCDFYKGKKGTVAISFSLMWWLEIGLLASFNHRHNGKTQWLFTLLNIHECILINPKYTLNQIHSMFAYILVKASRVLVCWLPPRVWSGCLSIAKGILGKLYSERKESPACSFSHVSIALL